MMRIKQFINSKESRLESSHMIKSATLKLLCISLSSILSITSKCGLFNLLRCLLTRSIGVMISIEVRSTSIIAYSMIFSSFCFKISHAKVVGSIIIIFSSGQRRVSNIAFKRIELVLPEYALPLKVSNPLVLDSINSICWAVARCIFLSFENIRYWTSRLPMMWTSSEIGEVESGDSLSLYNMSDSQGSLNITFC